ncbi:MAG: MBL fold metallo-hydrolase [Tissierellia bacterium]|nr:MBL fold metallo-hydrolase [Tissierellia bacterium]
MGLKVIRMPLGSYQTNCYILHDEKGHGIIIDPGAEGTKIFNALEEYQIEPESVILTHSHGDHVGALGEVLEKYNIPVYIHKDEEPFLKNARLNLTGAMGVNLEVPSKLKLLEDNDEIEFHGHTIKVIHTPGHTPGGISLYVDQLLFSGDTLFYGSIGRTDFPGGDYNQIIESIVKLVKLPDDVIVLSGHGPETNVKFERENNPFLRGVSL